MATPDIKFPTGSTVSVRDKVGDIGVVLRHQILQTGAIEYNVQVGALNYWYREIDLESYNDQALVWRKPDEYLRDLLLEKLKHPLADSLYAYKASRTMFEAYQFRPVFKFLQNPLQRLLIADEVGLGKTIEAILIYLELKARSNITQTLVICPSRLRNKWNTELRQRFDEQFVELDTAGIRRLLDQLQASNETMPYKAIVSFESLRNPDIIEQLDTFNHIADFVIIDEAHHLRNRGTKTWEMGRSIVDRSDAVIFLTATPLQMRREDLYNLLDLLAPHEFTSLDLVEKLSEPNRLINRAANLALNGKFQMALASLTEILMGELASRFKDNPLFLDILSRLRNIPNSKENAVALKRDIQQLNTFSEIITRTRKREMSSAAVRAAFSIVVEFSPAEQQMYALIVNDVKQELLRRGNSAIGFATIMRERQAASCLTAVYQLYRDMQNEHRVVWDSDKSIFDSPNLDDIEEATNTSNTKRVEDIVRSSKSVKVDSKFKSLQRLLKELFQDETSKVLLFSTFRRTIGYLQEHLQAGGYSLRVIHGDVPTADRAAIIDEFRTNPDIRLMISSEVGAEGLDFQFCDVLINYDLPWNPMQVEQRIGRLDRFGQAHPRIRIYNFYIKDTIESRIFKRLYDRIDIFRESIGDLEAILGEEIQELKRHILQSNLTPEEEIQYAENTIHRVIERRQEQSDFERNRDELLDQENIMNQFIDETISSGRIIAATEVRAAISTYLKAEHPRAYLSRDKSDNVWLLHATDELLIQLRAHAITQRGRLSLITTGVQRLLSSSSPEMRLTFDSDLARDRPALEFVTARHLLTDLAVDYWSKNAPEGTPCLSGLVCVGDPNDHGIGCFYLFEITQEGTSNTRRLLPIVILETGERALSVEPTLLATIQKTERVEIANADVLLNKLLPVAENAAREERDKFQTIAFDRMKVSAAIKESSLKLSYEALIRRTNETLNKVLDKPNLVQMYTRRKQNLTSELNGKLASLRANDAVIVKFRLLAGGTVIVK